MKYLYALKTKGNHYVPYNKGRNAAKRLRDARKLVHKAMLGQPSHKTRSYEENSYEEFKALAKKFGDPSKLTPAKFKRIRKICRNAAFANTGEWQKL